VTDTPWNRAVAAPTEFRVGLVFSRALLLLRQHWLALFGVKALCDLPGFVPGITNFMTTLGPRFHIGGGPALGAWSPILQTTGGVMSVISQALLMHYSFQKLRGESAGIEESIGPAGGRFFPIIGLSLVWMLACGFGLMLLLVPGVILILMWYVAVPACVVERLGP